MMVDQHTSPQNTVLPSKATRLDKSYRIHFSGMDLLWLQSHRNTTGAVLLCTQRLKYFVFQWKLRQALPLALPAWDFNTKRVAAWYTSSMIPLSPSLPSFHSGASLKRLMELNGLRWFSILGRLHVHNVSMTWLRSKVMKNHRNGNKDPSKREKPEDKLQRKTLLLFLDLGRLACLQAWGADRTASIPCHPQGKQFWGGPGQK